MAADAMRESDGGGVGGGCGGAAAADADASAGAGDASGAGGADGGADDDVAGGAVTCSLSKRLKTSPAPIPILRRSEQSQWTTQLRDIVRRVAEGENV
eukprot:6214578-Pleurochrysis_carterae.AAC.5